MPSFVLSRRRVAAGVLLLLLGLLLGARFLLGGGADAKQPAGQLVRLRASAAPRPKLVVHVVGAVRRPGLYRLAEGARVADALGRAGGATRRADLAALNLAAPLADGQQVVVPGRVTAPAGATGAAGTAGATGRTGGTPAPIQLSVATPEQLDSLPGIGPVTAEKIVAYRQEHGAFRSVEELDAVPGIGPSRVEQLRGLVVP